jgi:NAD(P)-dependent dehydrogenase (short-subunit alcohol dehydrogenase family)
VSSRSHRWGRIHWRDPQFTRGYHPLRAYAQAKLANLLFTYELRRRLDDHPRLTALAFDPGLVRTEIGNKHTGGLASLAWRIRRLGGKPAEEAAAHLVELAAAPLRQLDGGGYWRGGKAVQPSGRALDAESAGRLWLLSERLAGPG